jgi:hypothetical protein
LAKPYSLSKVIMVEGLLLSTIAITFLLSPTKVKEH